MHLDNAYGYSVRQDDATAPGEALNARLFQRLTSSLQPDPGEALFAKPYRRGIRSLAREAFDRSYKASDGLQPGAHRVAHLFLNQHVPHVTGRSMEKFRSLVTTRLPFLDADLIAAIMMMPPDHKLGDRVQAELIRRRAPALLNIPNANTGAAIGSGCLSTLAHQAIKRGLAKLGVPGYQPYERIGKWLRQDWNSTARRLLNSERSLDRGVLDRDAVARILDEHRTGRQNHTSLIMTMLAFEAGQQELLDD
ncbi:MAG: asparagine synthase [Rubritepida sp.]|nr:asparagine synthase [Rubritepida sp.]